MITEKERKEYQKQVKAIELFFKSNRKKCEVLIFTTPDPDYYKRISKIINQIEIVEELK